MKRNLSLFVLLLAFAFGADASSPYYRTFNKLRTVNVATANALSNALATAQTGDAIEMADGTYTGDFTIAHSDVMVQCLGHCIVNGHFNLTGANTWLWGLDVYSPTGGMVNATAPNTMVINNYIHGDGVTDGTVCYFTSENGYPDQLGYGNIIRNCKHEVYIQHDAAYGTEWLIANYIGEIAAGTNGRTIHAYTQTPHKLEKFVIEDNIVAFGEALLGGENNSTIPIYDYFKNNLFYKANLGLGWKRPNTINVIGNWFLNCFLQAQQFYGVGTGQQPPADNPSVITGNHFWNAGVAYGYDHFRFQTSSYAADGTKQDGIPKIRTADTWDGNFYHTADYLRATFFAGNTSTYLRSLSEWQNASLAAGKKFDTNAIVTQGAPVPGYKLVPNEFDPKKALLAVYAFNGAATVAVNFPLQADLRNVSDPYGAIVISGKDQVPVPLTGEFSAYTVSYTAAAPLCDMQAVEAKRLEALTILNDPNLKQNQKINRTRTKLNEMGTLLVPCLAEP